MTATTPDYQLNYVNFLTNEVNSHLFKTSYPHIRNSCFVSFCFGLTEEVYEVYDAYENYDVDQSKLGFELEIGDVFAYSVLLLRGFTNDHNLICNQLFASLGKNQTHGIDSLLLTYNGLLKRHFRGDDGFCLFTDEAKTEFLQTVVDIAHHVFRLSPSSLEHLLQANTNKLRKRYLNHSIN